MLFKLDNARFCIHNRKYAKRREREFARGEARTGHLSSNFRAGCIDERAPESSEKGLLAEEANAKKPTTQRGEDERGSRGMLDVAEIEYHAF